MNNWLVYLTLRNTKDVITFWRRNAELSHFVLQAGSLHPQSRGGTLGTSHHPSGFAKNALDMLALGVGQGDDRGQWLLT
jgi:hypothetical protein